MAGAGVAIMATEADTMVVIIVATGVTIMVATGEAITMGTIMPITTINLVTEAHHEEYMQMVVIVRAME